MVLIIGQGFLFLSFFMFFGAMTITPSGSLRRKDGEHVSVKCTFPDRAGALKFEYDGLQSDALESTSGVRKMESVGSGSNRFVVEAVGFGLNLVQTVQLNFNLTHNNRGRRLRCKFETTPPQFSEFLNFQVLFPPCCNASSPVSISHNTTNPFPPLTCSEIVGNRGNPPVCVQWSLTPSNSKCIGNPQGSCNESYNINPIGRECNNVTIKCMAKNEVGFTRKVFSLEVKSPPEQPGNCRAEFIDRSTGTIFHWEKPTDHGGFPLTYNITVYINGALSDMKLQIENDLDFVFTKGQINDVLKFFLSAFNALGTGPSCVSQLIIPLSPPASVNITNAMGTVTNITVKSFMLTFPSVQDAGRDDANVTKYIVYVNGNQRNFSAQPGNTQTFTIANLKDDTVYEITVSAVNSFDKESRRSGLIQVRILKTVEPPTQEITVSAVNSFDKESRQSDLIQERTSKTVEPPTQGEGGGGLSGADIAGIVVAIVVPIVAVVILVVYFKSRSPTEEVDGGETPKDENGKPKKKEPKAEAPKKPVDPDAMMYADLDWCWGGEARTCETFQYADPDHKKMSADEKKNMKEEQGFSCAGVEHAEEEE